MRRGTTPTHYFRPKDKQKQAIDMRPAEVIYMTYAQDGKTVIEKTKEDMKITEDEITIHLSQDDTLAFSTVGDVEIQCRVLFPDGNAPASKIIKVPVFKILKGGVIG